MVFFYYVKVQLGKITSDPSPASSTTITGFGNEDREDRLVAQKLVSSAGKFFYVTRNILDTLPSYWSVVRGGPDRVTVS